MVIDCKVSMELSIREQYVAELIFLFREYLQYKKVNLQKYLENSTHGIQLYILEIKILIYTTFF